MERTFDKNYFSVILNEVNNLNPLEIRDSSLRSECQFRGYGGFEMDYADNKAKAETMGAQR